ncbi:MAG TPA: DUF6789 family protein [Falsiroseomonas sp.]|jgi:hypothetical protein|nr:DUF6789 family protein [Falsiroseomonas sp.]
MTNIWIGMIAGLAATAVLSALMLMKQAINLMPQLDMIGMISGMMRTSRAVGWLVHFMVGAVVYGGAFAWLAPSLPGDAWWFKGVVLGAIGWLIAMLAMMPMAGHGLFGIRLGGMVPVMSLVMHLLFGAVLGWIYGLLIV